MASEWLIDTSRPYSNMPATNISFETCVYLILITLSSSISDGMRPSLRDIRKGDDRAHILRARN